MYSGRSDEAVRPAGLPHSDIFGSKLDCSSPKRFAAYRVLHQLFAPRHPPCALRSLNNRRSLKAPPRTSLTTQHTRTDQQRKRYYPFPVNRIFKAVLTLSSAHLFKVSVLVKRTYFARIPLGEALQLHQSIASLRDSLRFQLH